ncbi:MAG: cyclic nucleotide-binding domain-containing protein [Myxococcales bacterium]|nr:cyclic nucleotide-binding domain-containing protein [Myxococcales bacterium]
MTKLSRKRLEQHIQGLQKKLRGNPEDVSARLNLARTFLLLGEEEQAIRQYTNLARVAIRNSQFSNAIAACRTILRLRPDLPLVVDMLARLEAHNPANAESRVVRPISEAEAQDFISAQSFGGPLISHEPVVRRIDGHHVPMDEPIVRLKSAAGVASPLPPPEPAEPIVVPRQSVPNDETLEPVEPLRSADFELEIDDLEDDGYDEALEELREEDLRSIDESLEILREGDDEIDADWEIHEVGNEDILDLESVDLDKPAPTAGMPVQSPLFSGLDIDSFVRIMKDTSIRTFAENQELLREGAEADGLYVVVHGQVRLTRRNSYGEACEVDRLQDGDFFAEGALFAEPRSPYSVTATSAVDAMLAPFATIEHVRQRQPNVQRRLERTYYRRLVAETLAVAPLFRDVDGSQRDQLLGQFRWRTLEAGATIIREGERVDQLLLVGRGEVEIVRQAMDETIAVARMSDGDFIGLLNLLDRSPATLGVRATVASRVLTLPRVAFESLYVNHDGFRRAVERARTMRQLMLDAVYTPR